MHGADPVAVGPAYPVADQLVVEVARREQRLGFL